MNTKLPEKRGSVILSWVIPFAVGALITFLVFRYRSGFAYADLKGDRTLACLSDGAFVAGVILLGVGILVWVSTTGFFDMLSYGAHSLLVLFTPLRRPEDMPDYLTWRALRAERRPRPGRALLAAGLLFLLASALLLVLSRQQSI